MKKVNYIKQRYINLKYTVSTILFKGISEQIPIGVLKSFVTLYYEIDLLVAFAN